MWGNAENKTGSVKEGKTRSLVNGWKKKWEGRVTGQGIGQNGMEEKEKCNMELEEDAGTDLMKSLKNNWRSETNSWGCWARMRNPVSKEKVTPETWIDSP